MCLQGHGKAVASILARDGGTEAFICRCARSEDSPGTQKHTAQGSFGSKAEAQCDGDLRDLLSPPFGHFQFSSIESLYQVVGTGLWELGGLQLLGRCGYVTLS